MGRTKEKNINFNVPEKLDEFYRILFQDLFKILCFTGLFKIIIFLSPSKSMRYYQDSIRNLLPP